MSTEPKPIPHTISGKHAKLLILTSTYPRWAADPEPGFVHELAKRLSAQFHVTVLCPHAKGAKSRETIDGVSVVRYRYAPAHLETLVNDGGIITNLRQRPWKYLLVPTFVLAQLWKAWRLSRQHSFDVVHAHWLIPQGWTATILQYLPGPKAPLVVTSHGADLFALRGRLSRWIRQWVATRAASLTVVSQAMRSLLRDEGTDERKINVLPMGVDFDNRFKPSDPSARAPDTMLFVGRLVEKKGLPFLLDAMPSILAKRPNAHLDIVGYGPDADALRTKARTLGINHAITFHGPLPQEALPELYQRASVFVAPFIAATSGDEEGLPVALSEAIACGCPAVAGNVRGLRDLVGDQINDTWIVNPRNTIDLTTQIVAALENPTAANTRAAALRQHLHAHLDWTRIAHRYAQILLTAANGEK